MLHCFPPNPIEGLPRKLRVPVTGVTADVSNVVPGIRVGEELLKCYWFVENLGGPISGSSIINAGEGYPSTTTINVPLFSLTGQGSGAQATVVGNSVGGIGTVTVTAAGSGYIRGEMLGITTSNLGSGSGAVVSVNRYMVLLM